jgi:hypothetical protein
MITYDRLSQIIPADQALANKALQVALQQITGIDKLTLSELATTTQQIETTRDLPILTDLTEAVPPTTASYYTNNLAQGTGVNNTVLVTDVLGSAAGWNETVPLTRTIEILADMNLNYLGQIYQTMLNVINGVYDQVNPSPPPATIVVIPPGTPGEGTYNSADEAVSTGLIPAAQGEIASLISLYPSQISELNSLWNTMAGQVARELVLQDDANLVFGDLIANDRNTIYGLIFSLPSYGLQTEKGGLAQFIELVSDLTTQSGQAVVGVMRQGRNLQILNSVGIGTNTGIPVEPSTQPEQAELLPSTY